MSLHVGQYGSPSSQKSPAKVYVSLANDPLSQRKPSDITAPCVQVPKKHKVALYSHGMNERLHLNSSDVKHWPSDHFLGIFVSANIFQLYTPVKAKIMYSITFL